METVIKIDAGLVVIESKREREREKKIGRSISCVFSKFYFEISTRKIKISMRTASYS